MQCRTLDTVKQQISAGCITDETPDVRVSVYVIGAGKLPLRLNTCTLKNVFKYFVTSRLT